MTGVAPKLPAKGDTLSKPQLEEALWMAVKAGKVKELQQFFVEQKDHPHLRAVLNSPYEEYDEDGGHVLCYCVKEGRDKGSTFGGKDYGSCIEVLVENGVDINFTDKAHKTALSWAVTLRYSNYVSRLLKLVPDASIQDQNGMSPFHIAVQRGHRDMAACILDHCPQVSNTSCFFFA